MDWTRSNKKSPDDIATFSHRIMISKCAIQTNPIYIVCLTSPDNLYSLWFCKPLEQCHHLKLRSISNSIQRTKIFFVHIEKWLKNRKNNLNFGRKCVQTDCLLSIKFTYAHIQLCNTHRSLNYNNSETTTNEMCVTTCFNECVLLPKWNLFDRCVWYQNRYNQTHSTN